MDFGMALIALKRGETVARSGWNGKGMFLTLQNGSTVDGNNVHNEVVLWQNLKKNLK